MLEILEEQTGQQQIREPGGLTSPIMYIRIGVGTLTAVRRMATGNKGITAMATGRIGRGTDQMLIAVIVPGRPTGPAQETAQELIQDPGQDQEPRIVLTIKDQ